MLILGCCEFLMREVPLYKAAVSVTSASFRHQPQVPCFKVQGSGFRLSGLGFRVSGFGFRVSGFGLRIPDSGIRASGFGFRNLGSGLGF